MSNDKDAEQLTLDLNLSDTTSSEFTVNISGDDWTTGVYTGTDTITINSSVFETGDYGITDDTFTINTSFEEWVDTMPSMHKIKGMCEQYPAFQKEFEKFKQMYNLIKDDYEANNEDDYPF